MLVLALAIYSGIIKERVLQSNFKLKELEKLVYKDHNYINTFLLSESVSTEFYSLGKSKQFISHTLNRKEFISLLNKLDSNSVSPALKVTLRFYLDTIHHAFEQLVKLQLQKGFQDYGKSGFMRKHIHWFETNYKTNMVDVLMLRRHEKDYMLRFQEQYITKHKLLTEKVANELVYQNADAYYHLTEYAKAFYELAAYDKEIGLVGSTGIIPNLNWLFSDIEFNISAIIESNNAKMGKFMRFYDAAIFTLSLLVLGILLAFSIYISSRISRQLNVLATGVNDFIGGGFKNRILISYNNSESEIHLLTKNFMILQNEIIDYIDHFEQKIAEQTLELRKQTKEIEDKNVEILAQQEKVLEHLDLITNQKKALERSNLRFTESINYAKIIQQAVLPNRNSIDGLFAENFILFKPKDVLSGDFYWLKWNKDTEKVYLAVADCTGHGVPGALLSIMGISILDQLYQSVMQTSNPNEVLNALRTKFVEIIGARNSGKSLNDGMDIAFIELDLKLNILKFAGANRDVYIIRNGTELIMLKGNKMPIGKYILNDSFDNNIFELQNNDNIYLFTDGYNDQFGGAKNTKFMRKNFRKMLLAVQHNSFTEQLEIIKEVHKKWRHKNQQVDDILIIGFGYNSKKSVKAIAKKAKIEDYI